MLNREIRISLYVKKIFCMKNKKEWYLRDGTKLWLISLAISGNLRHVFLPQKLFCQYNPECDRGIDKTLGSISAVSPSVGFHFPEQRLTIEPNKTLAPAKTCQAGRADCHLSVSPCTHYTPTPLLGKGAPSPIFPEGRGVCTQII